MNYLLLGRVAKLVALLGFFLPWVTVSCSGTEIMQATGLQLMTGDIKPSEALMNMGADANFNAKESEPSPIVIAAFAALTLGLLLTLATKAKAAACVLMAGALLGMGLSYYAVENMQQTMTRSMHEAQSKAGASGDETFLSAEQQSNMAQAMVAAIKVERQEGFWLTVGAAGAAAILALLVLASGPAATKPEDAQPR